MMSITKGEKSHSIQSSRMGKSNLIICATFNGANKRFSSETFSSLLAPFSWQTCFYSARLEASQLDLSRDFDKITPEPSFVSI